MFDSTLRGNLLLARRAGDAPTDAELRSTLERAGLARLVAELPGGLDSRVGPAGTALSGGERQRLAVARALLSRADVLLLDEPSAHLDAPTAEDMMTDIRRFSRDRITVLVSHRPADRRADDRIVGLQGPPGRSLQRRGSPSSRMSAPYSCSHGSGTMGSTMTRPCGAVGCPDRYVAASSIDSALMRSYPRTTP